MKIETARFLKPDAIRQLCIRNDYCTCATNEEYAPIISESQEEELTPERALNIARRIYCLSDIEMLSMRYGESKEEIFVDICWGILNECARTQVNLIIEEDDTPCVDYDREHMQVTVCDDCQQVASEYVVDGENLCEDCLVSRMVLDLQNMIREIKDGYDIIDTAELLGYDIRRA